MQKQKQKFIRFVGAALALLMFAAEVRPYVPLVSAEAIFGTAVNYTVGTSPFWIFSEDLDSDGDMDLATANSGSANVSVLLNNGSGIFAAAVNYSVGGANGIYGGDLDNDGAIDLVSVGGSNASVLLNNGDGTFAAAVNYPVSVSTGVFIADLDVDGDADLAVGTTGNQVSILKNNGDGTFAAGVAYATGGESRDVSGGDIDFDADIDLVVMNENTGNAAVLFNDGTGAFAAPVTHSFAGLNPRASHLQDFDKDGDLDWAIAVHGVNRISVLMNDGNGVFGAPANYDLDGGHGPSDIMPYDFDNDGDYDLVTADRAAGVATITLNNGDGTFVVDNEYAVGSQPWGIAAADFDNDGDGDIAASNQSSNDVSVLLNTGTNTGPGLFGTATNYSTGGTPRSVFTADFNNDGRMDVATTNESIGELNVSLNSGTGTFPTFSDYALTNPAFNVFSADVDNSGWPDLLATVPNTGELAVLLNDGTGAFGAASYFAIAASPFGLFAGDFNNDALIDVSTVSGNTISVLLGTGGGSFAAAVDYAVDTVSARGIYGGDFDKDGDMDLTAGGTNNIRVFFNDGSGGFGTTSDLPTSGSGPKTVFAADLDNDGDIDLAYCGESTDVNVYLNTGAGSFSGPNDYSVGTVPRFITGGDFDNDGDIDLTVPNSSGGSPSISVLINDGSGAFGSSTDYAVSTPHGVAVADFNVDGDLDIASSGFSGNVSIFLAQAPVVNTAPVVGFTVDNVILADQVTQATDGSGIMTINFKVRDDESDTVTLVDFEYSTDRGVSWTPVLISSPAFGGGWPNNSGPGYSTTPAFGSTFSFTVDTQHPDFLALNTLDSTQIQFRFQANDGTTDSAFGTTEDVHVDNEVPVATLIFPNGGETLVGGQVVNIEWTASDDASFTPVDLELSTDNGANFTPIAGAVDLLNDGAYIEDGVIWGSSGGGNGQFNEPAGIAVDSEANVYVVDCCNPRIQVFTPDGTYIRQWGSFGSGNGQFDNPNDLSIDSNDIIYVADSGNDRIQKFTSAGVYISQWGTTGSGNGEFNFPRGIALDSTGNVYVADTFNDRIQKFDSNGVYISQFGISGSADGELDNPNDVVVDSSGNIFVADANNDRIQKFDSNGVFITKWGTAGNGLNQFFEPSRLVIDSFDQLIVSDIDAAQVQGFDLDGNFLFRLDVADPEGLGVGPQGYLYIGNVLNFRVERFSVSHGTFAWTVPATATSQALIRMITNDSSGNSAQDDSDAVFTILANNPFGTVEVHVASTRNTDENNQVTGISDGPGSNDITSFSQTTEYSGARRYTFDNVGVPTELVIGLDIDTIPSPTTLMLSDDDASAPIPVPFPVKMFGRDNNFIVVSSNGFIYLNETAPTSSANGCCSGMPMDTQSVSDGDDHLVSGAWADLYPPGLGPVEYGVIGSAPNRIFIVSWNDVSQCCNDVGGNTFQIKFFETAPTGGGGGRRNPPVEPPPEPAPTTPPTTPPVTAPPVTEVHNAPPLTLIPALKLLYGWMYPVDYQLTRLSERIKAKAKIHLIMKASLKRIGFVAGYSDGYTFNKPNEEPNHNVAELMKSIMISFSDCFSLSQMNRAIAHDRADNPGYWWAGYWHFMDPLMQRFFGPTYLMWAPISRLRILDVLDVFIADFCGRQQNL